MFMMAQFLYEERKYLMNEHKHPQGTSILEPNMISPTTMTFSIIVLTCSICGLIASVLLIYGLYKDSKILLIPWIFAITVHTFVDLTHSLYIFIVESVPFNPVNAILITMDCFLLSLNVYAFLCVVSQYQEYQAGRGTAAYEQQYRIPNVQYTAPTTATSLSGMRRAVTYQETRPTPTQSPTVVNTSLCTGLDESAPSSRRPSRKQVQFPVEHTNNNTGKTIERRDSSIGGDFEEPFTIDIKTPMLMVPD